MPQYKHKISKSRFVSGMQCEKKLYYDLFRSDLKPTHTEQQKALFESGNLVGELAQQKYPNGNDASPESHDDFSKSIEQTREWISGGVATIYEAAFFHDEVLAALDILHHQDNERWAIEVKSSSSLKDYHFLDASLQYWVMKQSGFKPDKFFLMHINSGYIKNGAIEVEQLFTLVDITQEVINNQEMVENKLSGFKLLSKETEPLIKIGEHCSTPFSCDYKEHCWQHIPTNSVFELENARGKDWKLYNAGIIELINIPDEIALSPRQKLHVEGLKNGTSYIDKTSIAEFVARCTYPLYFFDFETIFPAIPIVDNSSPFQQIPFQYSLHILEDENSPLLHKEFLAEPSYFKTKDKTKDPRKKLIEQLKLDFGATGSILAYNAKFEKDVLKKLALAYPEDANFLNDLINRFVDLLEVFRSGWYYKPEMKASASMKSVLPAIAPEFNYEGLEISDGVAASSTFLSLIEGTIEFTPEIKNNLLAYCKRDSEGMVILWKELINCITENDKFS